MVACLPAGFINGVHLWLVKINNLSEPDSIFIGLCRGCMPLDLDPQDLRDRTYYLSNGVIRVGGRRVATNAANFTKGDIVGVVLDADQGEIVFFRNGMEQGRARGIRGRLYPFISCDSEGDQVGTRTILVSAGYFFKAHGWAFLSLQRHVTCLLHSLPNSNCMIGIGVHVFTSRLSQISAVADTKVTACKTMFHVALCCRLLS